jgi:hypothetical protein
LSAAPAKSDRATRTSSCAVIHLPRVVTRRGFEEGQGDKKPS